MDVLAGIIPGRFRADRGEIQLFFARLLASLAGNLGEGGQLGFEKFFSH